MGGGIGFRAGGKPGERRGPVFVSTRSGCRKGGWEQSSSGASTQVKDSTRLLHDFPLQYGDLSSAIGKEIWDSHAMTVTENLDATISIIETILFACDELRGKARDTRGGQQPMPVAMEVDTFMKNLTDVTAKRVVEQEGDMGQYWKSHAEHAARNALETAGDRQYRAACKLCGQDSHSAASCKTVLARVFVRGQDKAKEPVPVAFPHTKYGWSTTPQVGCKHGQGWHQRSCKRR